MCKSVESYGQDKLHEGIQIGKSEGIEIGFKNGKSEGIEIGKTEGIQEMLCMMLMQKLGQLSQEMKTRIKEATQEKRNKLITQIFEINSEEDIKTILQ